MFWFYLFLFILGLQLGSFINAFNYRLQTGESVWRGRSHCPHCQHILSWRDLIPVLGFLLLKGRCRYCHRPISKRYPLVEMAAGFLLVIIWAFTASISGAIFYSIVFLALLAVADYDLQHYLISDKVLLFCLIIALVFLTFTGIQQGNLLNWPNSPLLLGLLAGALASIFLGLIHCLTRGQGMGFGDVKLAFILGLIVGWPDVILALFLSFFIGAIIGLGLVISKKKKMKEALPFGPFLVMGALITALWGSQIINWYLLLISQ